LKTGGLPDLEVNVVTMRGFLPNCRMYALLSIAGRTQRTRECQSCDIGERGVAALPHVQCKQKIRFPQIALAADLRLHCSVIASNLPESPLLGASLRERSLGEAELDLEWLRNQSERSDTRSLWLSMTGETPGEVELRVCLSTPYLRMVREQLASQHAGQLLSPVGSPSPNRLLDVEDGRAASMQQAADDAELISPTLQKMTKELDSTLDHIAHGNREEMCSKARSGVEAELDGSSDDAEPDALISAHSNDAELEYSLLGDATMRRMDDVRGQPVLFPDRFIIGDDPLSEQTGAISEDDDIDMGDTEQLDGEEEQLLKELAEPRPLLKHSKSLSSRPHMRYCCLNPRSRQFEWSSSPSGERHRQGQLVHAAMGISAQCPSDALQPGAERRIFHIQVMKSRDRPRTYHFTTPTEDSCQRWLRGLKLCLRNAANERR